MRFFTLFAFIFSIGNLCGQATYNMSNNAVVGCEGNLLDSGNGTPAGNYDHNEDYIFTICLPGNGTIDFSFLAFCLEEPYDYIYFYDGADTTAPVLAGPLTDATIPQGVSSTGNCMTLYFHSDANVACSGWIGQWTSDIQEPVLPQMALANSNPTCSTTVVTVNFDAPILCDSVLPANFQMGGEIGQTILSATALNCTNDSTTSVQLQLSPGLNQSGYYVVGFQTTIIDECQNVWELSSLDTLVVTDCPIFVNLASDDITLCQGECTEIDADPMGGNFLNYNYSWNPPLPNGDGPFPICPNVTTLYTVTLSDGVQSATDTLTIFVAPAPTINPILITICETSPPFNLAAIPVGGIWEGEGIIDSLAGTFDPSVTGDGVFDVTYYDPFGCPITTQITVNPVDAGWDEAACPSTAAFVVSGFSPTGGTWSGANITANGTFNPSTAGTFIVTYTLPNGCTANKTITVQNIALTPIDTVCESAAPFDFTFSPLGGNWSGNGIVNGYWGTFLADNAGDGLHTLTYSLQGCSQSFDIFVKEIEVPWGFTTCPNEPPFLITPAATPTGGVWSQGIGISNPITGLYNPAWATNVWNVDTLFYNVNGCRDTSFAFNVQTTIYRDTVYFCPNDPPLTLEWDNVQNTPWDGIWTGNGITDPDFPGTFDPTVAGSGTHVLHYNANTCIDSMVMIVRPVATPNDTSVCELSPAFALHTQIPNGIWAGTGITDNLQGIFDPQLTGVGTFTVFYGTPDSCFSSMEVTVYPLATPIINNLPTSFCWHDTSVVLTGTPTGGVFSGIGIVGNVFYPLQAGIGQHIISYTVGSGVCQKTGIGVTNVSPPLEVVATTLRDSICNGEYTTLNAQASAGGTAAYTYTWTQNIGVGAVKPVNPSVSTIYIVTAYDGCSDPASDTLNIYVTPPFSLDFQVTDTACFGNLGTVVVSVAGNSNYQYSWHTIPAQSSDTLRAAAYFDYDITVTDAQTGCKQTGNVVILGYPYVHASFLTNPTDECAIIISPVFNLIDLSSGASTGTWNFGDGTPSIPYVVGEAPTHTYSDTGKYVISLYVENIAGCSDSIQDTVCIVPQNELLYIPNAFTPNQDDVNDIWHITSRGILSYEIRIFDRWGKQVFVSENPDEGWDGTYQGKDCPEGVFTYRLFGKIFAPHPLVGYYQKFFEQKGTITLIR